MQCEKCGNELDAFALDCPRCVRAAATAPPPMTPPPPYATQSLAPPPVTPLLAPPYARPATNGLATAALVLGLCGLVTCGISCLVGLPLGIVGLRQIAKSPTPVEGRGMAIAGIVISSVLIVGALVYFIVICSLCAR